MAWALNGLCIWCNCRRTNPAICIEEFQFNWIRGKKSGFLERPITISWYCWQTKNHQAHRVKSPSKAIQVSKSMSHGSKWDRPNSIHCCYVSELYRKYIFWIHTKRGEIFSMICILDVSIPKIGHGFALRPLLYIFLKKDLEQHWHHHYRESGEDIVGTDGGLLLYKIRIGFQLKSRQSHSCLTSDWR